MLRVGVPGNAVNLAWVWAVPYLTAGFSTDSLAPLESNDVGWAALVSGAVALFWGVVLRPVLALLALHTKEAGLEMPAKAQGHIL